MLDNNHYVDSVGYAAVTAWAANTAISAGALRRQNATPSVGNERVFIAIVGGNTHATTEPTWTVTRGAKNTDNTVTWQECTGLAGVNGDITNTPTWAQARASSTTFGLGQVFKNAAETHLFITSTSGTVGASEPSFTTTTGGTTTDNAATHTCIGAVGAFTGNQAPHARIATALATNWAAAGNKVYVKSSHAATSASAVTLTGAGTNTSPIEVLCYSGSSYPPTTAATGASETTTAVGNMTVNGCLISDGVDYAAATNGGNLVAGAGGVVTEFRNCGLKLTSNGSSQLIIIGNTAGGSASIVKMRNVTMTFGHTSQGVTFGVGDLLWTGTSGALLGTIPTTLFVNSTFNSGEKAIRGVDFSAAGAGKTIVGMGSNSWHSTFKFANCRFHASATKVATFNSNGANLRVKFLNCDSGGTNYNNESYDIRGTFTTETTIVRTGGASDGTTAIAHKLVSSANANFNSPFESEPIPIWNNVTGSRTLTLDGIWGGGAVPTDADVSVEVEYLSASGHPLSAYINDAKASVMATAANQAAGTGTWGGSTTKFALAVTFTANQKGMAYARVRVHAASTTLYIDPKPVLS